MDAENLGETSASVRPDFIRILIEEFEALKEKNSQYSIRAYARKLKIHSASLSAIMRGERSIPQKHVLEILTALNLTAHRRNQFLRSLQNTNRSAQDLENHIETEKVLLDSSAHKNMILEWEYCAVLSALEIPGPWTTEKLAARFSLNLNRTEEVIEGLLQLEFIQHQNGNYSLVEQLSTRTTETVQSEVLRQAHENELHLALHKLKNVPHDLRDFSSRTMAIDKAKLPEAKKMIQKFRRELSDFLEDGSKSDVYMVGIQLFPLSETESE